MHAWFSICSHLRAISCAYRNNRSGDGFHPIQRISFRNFDKKVDDSNIIHSQEEWESSSLKEAMLLFSLTWVWHNLCQKIWQQISDLIPTVFLLNVFWILKFKWIFLITICRVSGSIKPKGLTKWRHICKTNHSCKTAFSHENLLSLPPRPNWMWGRKRLDSHHYIHYKCSLNISIFLSTTCCLLSSCHSGLSVPLFYLQLFQTWQTFHIFSGQTVFVSEHLNIFENVCLNIGNFLQNVSIND